jgi:predicted P-loop ATPase
MHPNDKVVKVSNVKRIKTVISYPDNRNGKPLDTFTNLKFLLDLYNIQVRWNIMLRVREITIPGIKNFVDEKENADLAYIYHLATTNEMPNKNLDSHLDAIAWNNTYHPIVECINAKPWDGIGRLDKFIGCIKTKDDDYSYKIIKRWMFSAITAAFSETGFSAQGVLVLQGNQNLGKTRWVKSLDPIKCGAVKEGLLLDPSNKDSVITASQCWIAELGELDGTFRKADIARIKSYITNEVDIIRSPYMPRNSYLNRRTVFVATVNELQYLVDDTGNRRWWTIEVESIDLNHGLDMQQVWAEIYNIYKKDHVAHWLSEDELKELAKINEVHEQTDPFEEKLLSYFDWQKDWESFTTIELSTTDVMEKLGYLKPTKADATRMGKIIIKHTGKKPKRRAHMRVHTLPLIKNDFIEPKF